MLFYLQASLEGAKSERISAFPLEGSRRYAPASSSMRRARQNTLGCSAGAIGQGFSPCLARPMQAADITWLSHHSTRKPTSLSCLLCREKLHSKKAAAAAAANQFSLGGSGSAKPGVLSLAKQGQQKTGWFGLDGARSSLVPFVRRAGGDRAGNWARGIWNLGRRDRRAGADAKRVGRG